MSWTKLHGEVTGKVDGSSFGCRVSECGIITQSSNTQASYRGGDDDARWFILRCLLLEERCEPIKVLSTLRVARE